MIAAFLCGLMFGALAYRAWCVRPITLKGECEPWDGLSDEALANFEGELDGEFGIMTDYVPDSGLRVCWPEEGWKRHLLFPHTTDSVGCGPPRNCPMHPLYGRTTSGG